MFGPPGRLYVYFIYGMHHCANIVTGRKGDGQAVLLRGVAIDGIDRRRTNGPGKLCDVLGIDMAMNGSVADVFDDGTPPPADPLNTVRVGITKAADLPRRWIISA
jgi:DNA-3-methyladenine glycosylase